MTNSKISIRENNDQKTLKNSTDNLKKLKKDI